MFARFFSLGFSLNSFIRKKSEVMQKYYVIIQVLQKRYKIYLKHIKLFRNVNLEMHLESTN